MRHLAWLVLPTFLYACAPPDEFKGNPNARPPPSADERRAIKDYREQRRQLADEVVNGDKSFAEADCEYRDGEWNDDRDLCVRHFSLRKTDLTTQKDALAKRLEVMASMSRDPPAAISSGKLAAEAFLTDHPEDYRGAMGAALRATRSAGYLATADKQKLRELTVEIPLIGTIPGEDEPPLQAPRSRQAHLIENP